MQISYLSDSLIQLSGGDWLWKQQQFSVSLSQTAYCVRDPHHQQPVPQIDSTIVQITTATMADRYEFYQWDFSVFST